jgi:hypothetical protein
MSGLFLQHQTKRKPTAVPSLLFYKRIGPSHSCNIFPIDLNNRSEKVAMGIDPAFDLVLAFLGSSYSKE